MTSTGFFECIAEKSKTQPWIIDYLKQDERWEKVEENLNIFVFSDKSWYLRTVSDQEIIKSIEVIGGKKVEKMNRSEVTYHPSTGLSSELKFYVYFKE
jgi:hypothetical protein